jgi:hypothetical protein
MENDWDGLDGGTPEHCWGITGRAAEDEEVASRTSLDLAPQVAAEAAWLRAHWDRETYEAWIRARNQRGKRWGQILWRMLDARALDLEPDFDPGEL